MSLGTFTTWAVEHAVDLVNLYSQAGDEVSREQLHLLVRNYGYPPTDLDVGDFHRLANELRSVFVEPDQDTRIDRLNELLDHYQPTPRIVAHDDLAPHLHYVVTGPPVDHVGSSFVMAMANAFVDHGWERFGWCAAPRCDNLFFDRSRNRSQRYCSRSCATRVNVRAHRARQ